MYSSRSSTLRLSLILIFEAYLVRNDYSGTWFGRGISPLTPIPLYPIWHNTYPELPISAAS